VIRDGEAGRRRCALTYIRSFSLAVKIFYLFQEVTPENFLNILQGNKDQVVGGSGKVIDRLVI